MARESAAEMLIHQMLSNEDCVARQVWWLQQLMHLSPALIAASTLLIAASTIAAYCSLYPVDPNILT